MDFFTKKVGISDLNYCVGGKLLRHPADHSGEFHTQRMHPYNKQGLRRIIARYDCTSRMLCFITKYKCTNLRDDASLYLQVVASIREQTHGDKMYPSLLFCSGDGEECQGCGKSKVFRLPLRPECILTPASRGYRHRDYHIKINLRYRY